MKYLPTTVLDFGINENYTLEMVYKYVPEYINWLMENHTGFFIDEREFYNLPVPTPFYNDRTFIIKISEIQTIFRNEAIRQCEKPKHLNSNELMNYIATESEKIVIEKTKQYFDSKNLTYPSLTFALKCIEKFGLEPEIQSFEFSKEALVQNALKRKKNDIKVV